MADYPFGRRPRKLTAAVEQLPDPAVVDADERLAVVERLARLEYAVGPVRSGPVERAAPTPPPHRDHVAARLDVLLDRYLAQGGRP